MQLFQNIKNFVARVVQAFSSLKNWLFGSNEPIQNEEEEREEQRSHLIPWVSPSLVKLCAIGITSKTALGLQSTCRMPILFPKKDDENGPPGSSFTWTTPVLQSQDDNISTNTAACAA
ncbi:MULTISPECIES: hypothetical protein [unclassified Legionella]|uniref:hypothetical protein n=1 Tax=unclassified Legionella TaxID=2622702 RepID=UPI001E544A4B|nr:hypothetical protein [Legionella sp. 31fI33]MCC5015837.1 hypothetical protein [Legionella sp. 31fI33]